MSTPAPGPTPDLTAAEIQTLVGTRHDAAGIEFPPAGLQPYHDWLIRTLKSLADASFGPLQVTASTQGPTTVHVRAGRAAVNSVALESAAQDLDLAAFNNSTVLIALTENAGNPQIDAAAAWPAGPHIKLAEATLAAGQITELIDRRFESVFTA